MTFFKIDASSVSKQNSPRRKLNSIVVSFLFRDPGFSSNKRVVKFQHDFPLHGNVMLVQIRSLFVRVEFISLGEVNLEITNTPDSRTVWSELWGLFSFLGNLGRADLIVDANTKEVLSIFFFFF